MPQCTPEVEFGKRPIGRIAKVIAHRGYCSRRDAEVLIKQGKVKLNGQVIIDPAINVAFDAEINIDGKDLATKPPTRIWLFHKPKGVITTHKDPAGRKTVFSLLPSEMPRVISVGRLDFNSEGLLLLTNDGELARHLELPATGVLRVYRCRVHGLVNDALLQKLKKSVIINNIIYKFHTVKLEKSISSNHWLTVSLKEGKNREIRKVFEHFGMQVTRLIRVAYGEYQLGNLKPGEVREYEMS
jgi:23S rRNA pseudouridine2605 synthase